MPALSGTLAVGVNLKGQLGLNAALPIGVGLTGTLTNLSGPIAIGVALKGALDLDGTLPIGVAVTGDLTTIVIGDHLTSPIVWTGTSGLTTVAEHFAGLDTGEPANAYIAMDGSVWFQYAPSVTGVLAVGPVSGGTLWLDLFSVTTYVGLALISSPGTTLAFMVSGGTTYSIRLAGVDASISLPVDVSWGFVADPPPSMYLGLNVAAVTLPNSVLASVTHADVGENVRFSIDSGATNLLTQVADTSGEVREVLILPSVATGTYAIRATGLTSGKTATFSLAITAASAATGGSGTVIAPAAPPTGTRWQFQDPTAGGLGTITFQYNPATMTSPHPERFLTPETTTAPNGQYHVWEGSPRAHEFSFTGYVDDNAVLTNMMAFFKLNRRFYLVDHVKRCWTVSFEDFQPIPKRALGKPHAHSYTAKVMIYEGPVQL
jgi:hypothetical protein